jgi:hypothetical protein
MQMKAARVSSDEQARQVLEVQSTWLHARASRDYGTLDAIAADEFTAVHADGSISAREHALGGYAHAFNPVPQLDELDVRFYGSVAVIFCRAQHPAMPRPHRLINVLVHRSRRWQLVTEIVS